VSKCESEGASIVLLGSFNPGIFQPAWFGAHGLIRPEEADTATINVIHPEVCAFATSWFSIQVLRDRFVAQASDAGHYLALCDLVLGVFQLLEHTPFDKMGLNRFLHFRMPSEEQWHAVGDLLAPKEPWHGILRRPGLRSLYIQDAPEELASGGTTVKAMPFIRVEPSLAVSPGVFIEVNKHHEATGANTTRALIEILHTTWKASLDNAEQIAHHILKQVAKK